MLCFFSMSKITDNRNRLSVNILTKAFCSAIPHIRQLSYYRKRDSMRTRDTEKEKIIIEFVDSFFEKKRRSPSVREIAAGTGIPRDTVHRYLKYLNDKHKIQYDGSCIITDFIDRMTTQNAVRIPLAGAITCGEFRPEEEWNGESINIASDMLGNGTYFALLADGDSMIGAGIDKGDYVIVRQTNTADIGNIVVALDDEGRNTLKRLKFDDKKNRPYLHAENKKYKDIYPDELSILQISVHLSRFSAIS